VAVEGQGPRRGDGEWGGAQTSCDGGDEEMGADLAGVGCGYRWPKSTRPVSPARSPLFGPGPSPAR
jgi:hypothetical protein